MRNLFILLLFPLSCFSQTKLDTLIFNKVNVYRASQCLNKLEWNSNLCKVASNQSDYMSKSGHLFHEQVLSDSIYFKVTPNFADKFFNCGFSKCHVGENLGVSFSNDVDTIATEIMFAWIDSPEHNKVLLDKAVKFIGIMNKTGDVIRELKFKDGDIIEIERKVNATWISLEVSSKK